MDLLIQRRDANFVHEQGGKSHPFKGHYAFANVPSMESKEWIIDYGASSHICCNPELLHTTYKLDKPTVIYLPDGSCRSVAFAGTARVSKDISLVDVLYVTCFTHNLLSVAQLVHIVGLKCIFYPTHCIFQKEQTNELVGVGKMKGNLYFIESVLENYYISFFDTKKMTAKDWHIFLGHPSITAMKHLNIGEGKFHSEALEVLENCEICLKAKQTREEFPVLNRRSQSLFEMVHADLWGPYHEYLWGALS